ncbi:MAG: ABC transporter permease subunit [Dehalococcoidia bacterium]|nr:ABC transporter permease subunit [Dehalococcoidia bacterium]
MGRYIMRRLFFGVVTIWIVTLIVFIGLRVLVPIFYADVVEIMVGEYALNDQALQDEIRAEYGLDRDLHVQYLAWLGDILQGDLGNSLFNGRSVVEEMRYRLPVSIELGVMGLLASAFIAVPIGIIAALRQDEWPDYVLRVYAVASSAVPSFWVAIMVITFGSLWFNWAPPIDFEHIWEDPVQHIKIMALPILMIALTPSGGLTRIMRSQMLEVLRQDYVRTARAKGLNESSVVLRHTLRNSLIPIVTIIGLTLPGLIAGSVLFEIIFVLPGMGQYLVSAIANLDYPVVQSTNLIFAVLIVLANLMVDISYSFIDPRIRYS